MLSPRGGSRWLCDLEQIGEPLCAPTSSSETGTQAKLPGGPRGRPGSGGAFGNGPELLGDHQRRHELSQQAADPTLDAGNPGGRVQPGSHVLAGRLAELSSHKGPRGVRTGAPQVDDADVEARRRAVRARGQEAHVAERAPQKGARRWGSRVPGLPHHPRGQQCWAPITHPCLAPVGGPGSGSKKWGGLCTRRGWGSEGQGRAPWVPPTCSSAPLGVCLLQSSRLGSQPHPLDPRHGYEPGVARISRPWHRQKLWGWSRACCRTTELSATPRTHQACKQASPTAAAAPDLT